MCPGLNKLQSQSFSLYPPKTSLIVHRVTLGKN